MAKKDVYAGYGIEFKNNKIYCEPLKKWISPLLPYGTNSKVGKAATWSIMHGNETITLDSVHSKVTDVLINAGITELSGSCPCHCNGCYCDAGCYNFPANKAMAAEKLIIAKYHTEWMKRAITAQIKADGITQCRIHAQGDFYVNNEYVVAWREIATECKDCTFWTYTKYDMALKTLANIGNLKIVPSITPSGFNFGTCAELLAMHRKLTAQGYKVHICACGTEYEKHCSDCKTGCKAIGDDCDYVLFIKHSVHNYKAGEKDTADFEAVKAIIRSQDN